MSSLAMRIATDGAMKIGDPDGEDVRALQLALSQAGYKVALDGFFGPQTEHCVETFQQQQGLTADGIVGPRTAALLDSPHAHLVATAEPLTSTLPAGNITTPHDDTASLLAFYGRPWEDGALLFSVTPPFLMWYGAQPVHTIRVHAKVAAPFLRALNKVWDAAGHNADSPVLQHVKHFSGSYNYRPIRGSSRLSCHAFGAAIDFDAENLPMGVRKPSDQMPREVVDAFKSEGFFWGGDFRGRPDDMHVQMAHE